MNASQPVNAKMHATITKRLSAIAQEENVLVLIAIESGSRAWGFHSPDSDYDMRFVYARPVEWHLKLGKKRDVIEHPIDDELDISGWDIGKALSLALKGNAVIAEWLQSPIVYDQFPGAITELTEFCRATLSRRPVTWHYLSLLKRHRDRMRQPDGKVRLKSHFYMLRPALALRWIRINGSPMPPMDMASLLAGCDLSSESIAAIDRLTEQKKSLVENSDVTGTDPLIDALMESEIATAKGWLEKPGDPKPEPRLLARANDIHSRICRAAGN